MITLNPGLGICILNNLTKAVVTLVPVVAAPSKASYGASAEWIVERPGLGNEGSGDLPAFTPVTFRDCAAGNASNQASYLALARPINMVRLADTLATAEISENSIVTVTFQNFI